MPITCRVTIGDSNFEHVPISIHKVQEIHLPRPNNCTSAGSNLPRKTSHSPTHTTESSSPTPASETPSNLNTAANKVFANKDVILRIFGWIDERKDLAKCLLLNKEGLEAGTEVLYRGVHEKVMVRVAEARSSLVSPLKMRLRAQILKTVSVVGGL